MGRKPLQLSGTLPWAPASQLLGKEDRCSRDIHPLDLCSVSNHLQTGCKHRNLLAPCPRGPPPASKWSLIAETTLDRRLRRPYATPLRRRRRLVSQVASTALPIMLTGVKTTATAVWRPLTSSPPLWFERKHRGWRDTLPSKRWANGDAGVESLLRRRTRQLSRAAPEVHAAVEGFDP